MDSEDYSHLPMNERLEIGANYYQKKIVHELEKQNVHIVLASDYHTDAILKIDGYLNGDTNLPVQIKHRRTSQKNRNDLAFEVCRNHKFNQKIINQLKNEYQKGRDYKGSSVVYYFLLNKDETCIHQICSDLIRKNIHETIEEHESSNQNGYLSKKYLAKNGTELIATKDNDSKSFTPRKVMAFIPVEGISVKTYDIISRPN